MSDPEHEREELDQEQQPDPGEPWAKTSSGDADSVTQDESDDD